MDELYDLYVSSRFEFRDKVSKYFMARNFRLNDETILYKFNSTFSGRLFLSAILDYIEVIGRIGSDVYYDIFLDYGSRLITHGLHVNLVRIYGFSTIESKLQNSLIDVSFTIGKIQVINLLKLNRLNMYQDNLGYLSVRLHVCVEYVWNNDHRLFIQRGLVDDSNKVKILEKEINKLFRKRIHLLLDLFQKEENIDVLYAIYHSLSKNYDDYLDEYQDKLVKFKAKAKKVLMVDVDGDGYGSSCKI